MSQSRLRFVVRTPTETIVDEEVDSIRVPTQSGQVGLRPRGEPNVMAIESGLIVFRSNIGTRYAGCAGGMLRADRYAVSLLTPLAVAGEDIESVKRQLDAILAAPNEEMEVRRTLGRLETRILQELQPSEGSTATDLGKK